MTVFLGTKNIHLYICNAFIRYKYNRCKNEIKI